MTDKRIKEIETELKEATYPDVINHYNKLLEAINDDQPEYKDYKILIFHPVNTGDVICSSLCAELFQIKYHGCIVEYLTEIQTNADAIRHNPFINGIYVSRNWDLFKKRTSCEDGELKEKYDLGYSLYWWNKPNLISSFLEDLELPTDYTRLKLYRNYEMMGEINKIYPKSKFRICLQEKENLGVKWDVSNGKYEKLKEGLEKLGDVITIGFCLQRTYDYAIELLRSSDMYIGCEGSLSHSAGAVGCQSISLSPVYDPNWVAPQVYQNKYLPEHLKHVSVRPKDWCGDYHCIDWCNSSKIFKHPPYGYRSELQSVEFPNGKVPPSKVVKCDYKNFTKTCIEPITVEEWLEEIYKAYDLRKGK